MSLWSEKCTGVNFQNHRQQYQGLIVFKKTEWKHYEKFIVLLVLPFCIGNFTGYEKQQVYNCVKIL